LRRLWQALTASYFEDCLYACFDTTGKVVGAKMRDDHLADNPACDCVGENPFETVADLNPELAVVFYYEENNAVVEALFPYLPRIGYFDAEALQVLSLKTGDRKYRDLIARLLLETGQALFHGAGPLRGH